MTRDNVVMGTPNYMSPEQASGHTREVDARTDIFALGAILYEALSGRRAFDADGLPQVLHQICYEDPPPLPQVAPQVTPAVARVVARCLAKDPSERFPSTRVLLRALTVALRGPTRDLGEIAAPAPEPATSPTGLRPRAWAWAGSVVLAGLLASAATRAATEPSDPPVRPPAVEPTPVPAPTPSAAPQPTLDPALVPPGARLARTGATLIQADLTGLGLWRDADPPAARAPLPSASPVTALYAAPSGLEVWVGQADGTLSRWSVADPPRPIWHGRPARAAIHAVTAGQGYVAVATDNDVRLLARRGGKTLARFRGGTRHLLLTPSSASPLLLAVGDGSVRIFDTGRRRQLARLPLVGTVRRASLRTGAGALVEIDVTFDHGASEIVRTYRLHRPRPDDPLALELVASALTGAPGVP